MLTQEDREYFFRHKETLETAFKSALKRVIAQREEDPVVAVGRLLSSPLAGTTTSSSATLDQGDNEATLAENVRLKEQLARMEAEAERVQALFRSQRDSDRPQRPLPDSGHFALDGSGVYDKTHLEPAAGDAVQRLRLTSPGHFFYAQAVLDSVESGAIAPLRGSWLVALHDRGDHLACRQRLPLEAFWTFDELRAHTHALLQRGGDSEAWGLLFIAISYRWLTKEDPDPKGFHLGKIANVMRMYLERPDFGSHTSPLAAAFDAAGLGQPDCAVFWDYASLYQPPRTEEEQALFRMGLEASNIWYGNLVGVVWMQSELPPEFDGVSYRDSGWCFVEAAMSAVIKSPLRRLDLARMTEHVPLSCITKKWIYGGEETEDILENRGFRRIDMACVGQRRPPLAPTEAERLLRDEKKFTNSVKDSAVVAKLYRQFFDAVAQSARSLEFRQLGWGSLEASQLAAVLPDFEVLQSLDVRQNPTGWSRSSDGNINDRDSIIEEGAKALAAAVVDKSSIDTFNGVSLIELREGRAQKLELYGEGIGETGGRVLAMLLPNSASSLFRLNLSRCCLGDGGCCALSDALKKQAGFFFSREKASDAWEKERRQAVWSLERLNLSSNAIGAIGARALAEALPSLRSLEELSIHHNAIGDDGCCALLSSMQASTGYAVKIGYLNLCANGIGARGANALVTALPELLTLKEVHLELNPLLGEGSTAVLMAARQEAVSRRDPLGLDLLISDEVEDPAFAARLKNHLHPIWDGWIDQHPAK